MYFWGEIFFGSFFAKGEQSVKGPLLKKQLFNLLVNIHYLNYGMELKRTA
jgi:hypothetical protein